MSGPKVVRYNMNSFKGKLKEFMRKQVHLTQLQYQLQTLSICDEAYNIQYNCKPDYEKVKAEIEKALVAMVFDYKGDFSKNTYDKINNKINQRTAKLDTVIKKCEGIVDVFKSREKDYQAFLDYDLFMKNVEASFEKFKKEIAENIQKDFAKDNKQFIKDAQKKHGTVVLEEEKKEFAWGFAKKAKTEKELLANHLLDKENEIREIRKELIDKVIASGKQRFEGNLKLIKKKPNQEIDRITGKINLLMDSCDDKSAKEEYAVQFSKLRKSKSMNDVFFYQEMHDRIMDCENTRKNKLQLNDLLVKLNQAQLDASLDKYKQEVIEKILKQIQDSKVSDKETAAIIGLYEKLQQKDHELKIEEEIKKKEQQFIKAQIIHSLENKGYEVMEDLQVIDFEKENDLHLQAPGQSNLLNLKFKEDGTFRYVFQIPENKEELSTDQQKMKVHEMKSTCDDFVNVLKELKEMGVDIDVLSDKPIELSSMVTIPEKVKSKLKLHEHKTKQKQQIKKLYLDQNGN